MRVQFGNRVIDCDIASTPDEHVLGLQRHASLAENEGLLFLFPRPKTATFWMGAVRFPIDIVGLDAESRVTKIVEGAMPGAIERWTFSRVAAVLEVPARTCRKSAVCVGDVLVLLPEGNSKSADLLSHNDWHEKVEDHPAHGTTEPGGKASDVPKEEYFEQIWGPDLAHEALDGPVMRSAQIVDEEKFVEKVATIIFGQGGETLQWSPTALDGGATERTVITRRELTAMLGGNVQGQGDQYILDAASSDQGLSLIGDAFILAGQADTARVGYANREPLLVLYREKK